VSKPTAADIRRTQERDTIVKMILWKEIETRDFIAETGKKFNWCLVTPILVKTASDRSYRLRSFSLSVANSILGQFLGQFW